MDWNDCPRWTGICSLKRTAAPTGVGEASSPAPGSRGMRIADCPSPGRIEPAGAAFSLALTGPFLLRESVIFAGTTEPKSALFSTRWYHIALDTNTDQQIILLSLLSMLSDGERDDEETAATCRHASATVQGHCCR